MRNVDDIVENARRLRTDAQLLFKNKRYVSCGLLQVICPEELGKAYLVVNEITKARKDYHLQKQEAAISLSAAVRLDHLLEETCQQHGWDYWRSQDDAAKYYAWMMSEDGKKAINEATKKISSWLRVTRHGTLEKIRRVAAYVDEDSPAAIGRQIEEGKLYTYKIFDENFCVSAFEFIDMGFECLDCERLIELVELFRTTMWKVDAVSLTSRG